MNPRHATAVLLLASGAFALLVACIGGGVGIARWAGGGPMQADFLVGWLVCTGGLPLVLGIALLVTGVRLYRTSDHRLEEVRDDQGQVVRRLPVLSPLWLALFGMLTLLGLVLVLSGGLDFSSQKGSAVAIRYGLIVFVLVSALARWYSQRAKGREGDESVKQKGLAGESEGPKWTE